MLALSGCLLWYSISTYRLSGQNRLGDFSARFFPEAQILNGHSRYLVIDLSGAAESYKKAIIEGPSFLDAWMGLARSRIASGRMDEARNILKIIAPSLASIGTWKLQELQLAFDLHDEPYFVQCYNYILSYLPHHAEEAVRLASQFWGGWEDIIPHVFFPNRPLFLSMLIDFRQVDAAVALFRVIEQEGPELQEKERLRFCDFLISNDRIREAETVWRLRKNPDSSLIDDGRFEAEPLNTAFGWRFRNDPDALVERTADSSNAGKPCLHVHFNGTGNVNSDLAYQIVPVRAGTSYIVLFVRRSSGLTTDRGVFLGVEGFRKDGLKVASEPALGDSPWKEERIEFTVPSGCEAVVLHVRRDESLKMDNKISGDYWLGSVVMVEQGKE